MAYRKRNPAIRQGSLFEGIMVAVSAITAFAVTAPIGIHDPFVPDVADIDDHTGELPDKTDGYTPLVERYIHLQ